MAITSFSTLVAANHDNEGVVRLKLSYVDMAGDLIAGLVLSELMYWYAPSKDGRPDKLRIIKKGAKWIACPRDKWHERARITARQFDRAIKILIKLKLVERKLFRFNGSPTVHVRIIEDEFLRRYNAILEGIILDFDESVNYTKVKVQENETGNSSTTKRRKHITSDTPADTTKTPDAGASSASKASKPKTPKANASEEKPATGRTAEKNALFDEIVRVFKYDPKRLTKSERSSTGKAAYELLDAGYRPEHVRIIYGYMTRTRTKAFNPAVMPYDASAAIADFKERYGYDPITTVLEVDAAAEGTPPQPDEDAPVDESTLIDATAAFEELGRAISGNRIAAAGKR